MSFVVHGLPARAMSEEDIGELRRRLELLRTEHRDLDQVIDRLTEQGGYDQLLMRRLKKRKLVLKDQIASVESAIVPDIIA
jgi:hypothetical protein